MADDSTPSSPTPETPPPRTTGGGFRWEPPTAAELQNLMPGYTIEKILGRGGMGAVYRGIQTNLDRPVAIKILPPGVEKEDPSFAERFKNEAKLMAKLMHPGVVGVFDFGKTSAGQLYFVMEYVDGSDVSQMIAAQGRLPPEHALAITAHVCDALQAAHELGIVHRDIKPANILLNMKGQVKVADFGLAKVEEPGTHGLTKTGYAMGTPDFVAPEALMLGTAIDGRADLYAVGVMLYQMLTGNIPRGAFRPASVLVPGLDPRFDSIIMKAMQHDRADRHQSAAELRRELDVILTVPFVRNDAPVSAAIPVAQVAQAPGQRSAAQKPAPQSRPGVATARPAAAAPKADGRASATPILPPKSKAPLFIGLGAAAVIGIGAFVMLGGGKKAKPSTPLAPSSGTNTPASKTSETSKPAASPSAQVTAQHSGIPPLPTTGWKPFITDMAKLTAQQGVTLLPGGWIRMQAAYIEGPPQRDVAVRTRLRFKGVEAWGIKVREQRVSRVAYTAAVSANGAEVMLRRTGPADKMLAKAPLPRPLTLEQEYELALSAMGDTLTVYLDGQPVLQERDTTSNDSATTVGASALMEIKDPQWLPLSPSSAAPFSSSSAQFPPGKWVKAFTKVEDLPPELRKPDSGVKFEAGVVTAATKTSLVFSQVGEIKNGGWRATIDQGAVFEMRVRDVRNRSEGFFALDLGGLHYKSRTDLSLPLSRQTLAVTKPAKVAQTHRYELVALDDKLFVRVDDSLTLAAASTHEIKGALGIQNFFGTIRDIEVINLDGLPEAEALKILGVDEKGNDLRQKPAAVASTETASQPSNTFPPGQWVKADFRANNLGFLKALQLDSQGAVILNGANAPPGASFKNVAVKGTVTVGPTGDDEFFVWLRSGSGVPKTSGKSKALRDQLRIQRNSAVVMHENLEDAKEVGKLPAPAAWPYAFHFAAVGDKLYAASGSSSFLSASARSNSATGGLNLYARGNVTLHSLEVINLDGLPEAEALRILGVDEKGNDLRALAAKQEQQKAEMAKAADAMAAIPELKTLHEQFVKLQAERVTAPFEAEVAKLNAGYVGGIDREIANEKKAGHLDGVIALEAEKKLIADQQPVPAEDDEKATEALKKLRGIYRAAYAKLEATRAENLKALTDPLSIRLKQLESTLTQQNRIDHAKTVREYREGLGKPQDLQRATNNADGASSSPAVIEQSSKYSQREVAEWVLGFGGAVTIEDGRTSRVYEPGDKLPAGQIVIEEIKVAKGRDALKNPWPLTDEDIKRFKGLRQLRHLEPASCPQLLGNTLADMGALPELKTLAFLNCRQIQMSAFADLPDFPELTLLILPGNPDWKTEHLKALPSLKKLERLWVRLGTDDTALDLIAERWPALTDLRLNDSGITDASLSKLGKLQKLKMLHLVGCKQFMGDGLMALSSLPKLTELRLGNPFPPQKLALLSQLKQISNLNLTSDVLTGDPDECIRQLSNLTGQLKTLSVSAPTIPKEIQEAVRRAMTKTVVKFE